MTVPTCKTSIPGAFKRTSEGGLRLPRDKMSMNCNWMHALLQIPSCKSITARVKKANELMPCTISNAMFLCAESICFCIYVQRPDYHSELAHCQYTTNFAMHSMISTDVMAPFPSTPFLVVERVAPPGRIPRVYWVEHQRGRL